MDSHEINLSNQLYTGCTLCPRNCRVDRRTALGVCRCSDILRAARAGLHYYEEPFLSGTNGSGTVFFSGCSLGCIYCQNGQISFDNYGFDISIERLAEIFLEQQARKAHNINLVTGTHYTPSIACALEIARANGLTIPVVWNSSGYEKPDTLKLLDGLVDIFMPDFKTLSPELGAKYMKAPDYPEWAQEALACMVEMAGDVIFEDCISDDSNSQTHDVSNSDLPHSDSEYMAIDKNSETYAGENVLMKRGVVVRHLMIPGQLEDSKNVIRYLYETYGDKIWISLMSQYTPVGIFADSQFVTSDVKVLTSEITNVPVSDNAAETHTYCSDKATGGNAGRAAIINSYRKTHPELFHKVSRKEYDELVDYAIDIGVENCMIQEDDVADDSFIPEFDGSGIQA